MNHETASSCLAEILAAIDEGADPRIVGTTAIANREAIRKAVKSLKPKTPPRESTQEEDYFYY